jgi:hypothetical protein
MKKWSEQKLLKEKVQMANKHTKKCSTFLRNVSQSHIKISLQSSQNGYHQEHKHNICCFCVSLVELVGVPRPTVWLNTELVAPEKHWYFDECA